MRRVACSLVGLVWLAMSCSQDGSGATTPQNSVNLSPSSSPSSIPDPLVGEWRQEFTCDDVVRTFRRGTKEMGAEGPATFAEYVRPMAAGAYWLDGAKLPPRDDLCRYAPASWERTLQIQDGQLVWFDPGPVLGAQATYELVDDHTFTANDGDQNIDGTYTFEFQIHGDRLTIDPVDHDPFVGNAVEVAPFVRVS